MLLAVLSHDLIGVACSATKLYLELDSAKIPEIQWGLFYTFHIDIDKPW